jgi:hypothetical protein
LARRAVHRALASGQLVKGPCEVCGTEEGVEAHHADYSRPLDVTWLCIQHHAERHGRVFSTEGIAAMAETGRPRKVVDRHLEDFASVGEPPQDCLALPGYCAAILAIDIRRMILGRADQELSSELRAHARAISATLSPDRIYQAEDALRRDGEQANEKPSGEEELPVAADGEWLSGPPPRVD